MNDPNLTMAEYIQLEEEKLVGVVKSITGRLLRTVRSEVSFDFENEYPAIVYNNTLTSEPEVSIDFENEFPAIVYNDASIIEPEISVEPTISSYPAIKVDFNFKILLSDSDNEDYTFIYDKNSSSNNVYTYQYGVSGGMDMAY
uniref:Uncharacterized protein n=1 Tax=Tanacetum cinerariifolium TaxID=118510 RepID=A0A699IEC7_TANCI|nr:hypothetical protein [Tanacetum cinerariifolium]